MMVLYKPHIDFLAEHAVDPDKRRYAVPEESPRHYIDIDHYGNYPYDALPRKWSDAVAKYSEDTLNQYGIVPWWLQTMLFRLTDAFKEKNQAKILILSRNRPLYIRFACTIACLQQSQRAIHRSERDSWVLGKPYP